MELQDLWIYDQVMDQFNVRAFIAQEMEALGPLNVKSGQSSAGNSNDNGGKFPKTLTC